MAKHPSRILDLARKGAEYRYQELKTEIAALRKYFPELTQGGNPIPTSRDGVRGPLSPRKEPSRSRERSN